MIWGLLVMNKKNIPYSFLPDDLCFRIWKFGENKALYQSAVNFELVGSIKFKEIISSEINVNFFDTNDLTLQLQFDEDFYNLVQIYENDGLILERLIYESPNFENEEYNQFYFINYLKGFHKFDEQSELILGGYDFKGFVEKKVLILQNRFYAPPDLTVDPDDPTQYIIPYDFNSFVTGEKNQKQIFDEIIPPAFRFGTGYSKSAPDLGANPYYQYHWLNGVNVKEYLNAVQFYDTVLEKISFFDFKEKIYNFYGLKNFAYHRVETRIDSGGKIDIDYNLKRTFVIDNLQTNDKFLNFSYEIDDREIINLSYNESDRNDLTSNNRWIDASTSGLTTFYKNNKVGRLSNVEIEKFKVDEIENYQSEILINQNIEKLKEFETKRISQIEIEFSNNLYFKDFDVCDFIELINFNELINGSYLVKKINEIIEEDYVSYSMDLERV